MTSPYESDPRADAVRTALTDASITVADPAPESITREFFNAADVPTEDQIDDLAAWATNRVNLIAGDVAPEPGESIADIRVRMVPAIDRWADYLQVFVGFGPTPPTP